jgi:hypothetical protein
VHRPVDLVQRAGGRRCQQCLRGLGVTGELLGGGGLEHPPRPLSRIGRERRGALQKGAGRCQPAPRARARPTVPARGRRPRRARRWHAHDARRDDQDRARGWWPPPAPDARRAAPPSAPRGRSLSAGAGGGTRPAVRRPATHPPALKPAHRWGFRAPPRHGRAAPAHPSDRPQPRGGSAASLRAAAARAAESSLRCGLAAIPCLRAQTRPPAPPAATHGGAPAARGGCRASRRVSGQAPARRRSR